MRHSHRIDIPHTPPSIIDVTDSPTSPAWIGQLAEWVADRPGRESTDISKELRGWSRRLNHDRQRSAVHGPAPGWLRNLAVWVETDERPEAELFGAQIRAWARAMDELANRQVKKRVRRVPEDEPAARHPVRPRSQGSPRATTTNAGLAWSTPLGPVEGSRGGRLRIRRR